MTLEQSYSDENTEFLVEEAKQQQFEPIGSAFSSKSLEAKQTGVTQTETFSSGEGNDVDADGLYYSPDPQGLEFNDDDDCESQEYSTFSSKNKKAYTDVAENHAEGEPYLEEEAPCDSGEYSRDAVHQRNIWEDGSVGYATCESRTLHTHMEASGHDREFAMYDEDGIYDDEGHCLSAHEDRTIANSTIATQSIGTAVTKHHTHFALEDVESRDEQPVNSVSSESSWGEETRDMSLMDSGDVESDEEDDESDDEDDAFDDDDDSSEDDDSSYRRPHSVIDILKGIKNCALDAASGSFEDGDFEFLPDVAQASTGVTTATSGSSHYDKRRKRRPKRGHTAENLFSRVSSALGEEFRRDHKVKAKKGKGKPRRRRDEDPATRIVESLRTIFTCGRQY